MALGCYGSCRESYERPQMEKSDAYANRNEVFRLKKVCANCPFRKDIPFDGLSEDRVNDLRRRLNNGEPFHCHKTLDYSKLDDEVNDGVEEPTAVVPQTQFCAGARATMELGGSPNVLLELGRLLGIKTDGFDAKAQPVHSSVNEWADALAERDREAQRVRRDRLLKLADKKRRLSE